MPDTGFCTEVRICGSCYCEELETILDLGEQPLAERDNGYVYPLKLLQCPSCSLVQLSCIVDQREVFPPDHPYTSGSTRALHEHFENLATHIPKDGLVVDIGANDGTFLSKLPHHQRVAVEPTGQAQKCRDQGIPAYQEFFTPEVAKRIVQDWGPAAAVTAINVFAHVPDPHGFLQGVKILLAHRPGGLFITENHDVEQILAGLQFDTVYHEHLRYYSISSLGYLLSQAGFTISGVRRIKTHGGSFRTLAHPETTRLQPRALRVAGQLNELCQQAASVGPVYGVGATTRATPLIHYAGLNHVLACVCEVPGSEKIGMNMPGTQIPVVPEARLLEDQPPYALMLSWHLAGSIIPKLREKGYLGKFIIPLPEPRIWNG
jgi:hypothetical protein